MNASRTVLALAAIGLLVTGCGGSSEVTVDQPLADAATVVCQPDGPAYIEPATIRAHGDGVHLRVDSPADTEWMLLFDEWGYEPVPPGVNDVVLSVPPGEHRLTCVTETDEPDEQDWPVLTVVDVDGVWADRTLPCDHPTGDHNDYEWDMTDAPVPPGRKGDLVDLAREDLPRELDRRIRRRDQLELAGYRDATSTVRLVRGGKIVALIDYRADGQGGWHVGGWSTANDPTPASPPARQCRTAYHQPCNHGRSLLASSCRRSASTATSLSAGLRARHRRLAPREAGMPGTPASSRHHTAAVMMCARRARLRDA